MKLNKIINLKNIFLAIIFLFSYMRFVEPNLLITNNTKVENGDIKLKVAVFSDTHFGKMYKDKNITKIVNKINKENPDIVIFTGDFFNKYYVDKDILDLELLYSELTRINCKYKFAVNGNHDLGGGANTAYKNIFTESGFTLLDNDEIFIEERNVTIVGFSDMIFGELDTDIKNINNDNYTIILSHEPDVVDSVFSKNNALMLSGHTHGGQITAPFVTKYILPYGGQKYLKGLFQDVGLNGNISLFVTKGIGMTMLPLRFLNVPEVAILEIS